MATRRTPIRQWETDKRVATLIINRLKRFVMMDATAEPPEVPPGVKPPKSHLMTDAQVRAALGILKKYMPDLKSIEHSGDPDHPVVHEIRRVIIDSPNSADGASVPAAAEPE